MRMKFNCKIYGDELVRLRNAGYTLQELGDMYNLSRERVRQILLHYPGAGHVLLTTPELLSKLGISPGYLISLCRKLNIKPVRAAHGMGTKNLWDKDIFPALKQALDIKCRICGNPVHLPKWVYCSDMCRKEGEKYKNRPPESQKSHNESTRKWQKNHPEVVRAIQKRTYARIKKQGGL